MPFPIRYAASSVRSIGVLGVSAELLAELSSESSAIPRMSYARKMCGLMVGMGGF